MKENDILNEIKNSVREELNREANKTIEDLCHKLRYELGKHKYELVTEILNRIDITVHKDNVNQEVVFQINIRGGMQNDR